MEEIPVIPFALASSFNSATVFPLKSSCALGAAAFLGAAFFLWQELLSLLSL